MVRKLIWVLAVFGVVAAAFAVADAVEARRRRELWAEATD